MTHVERVKKSKKEAQRLGRNARGRLNRLYDKRYTKAGACSECGKGGKLMPNEEVFKQIRAERKLESMYDHHGWECDEYLEAARVVANGPPKLEVK